VSVHVDNEVRGCKSRKKEAEVNDTLEVPQDQLHSGEMWLPLACIWRHTCWTMLTMSEQVKKRYCSATARLQ
jgi:hypothetical protein